MTSETSENTIFVPFYFTCYLMLTSPYMPPMNDALAKQEFSWKLNQSNPNPTSFQEIIATNVHLPYLVCLKRK